MEIKLNTDELADMVEDALAEERKRVASAVAVTSGRPADGLMVSTRCARTFNRPEYNKDSKHQEGPHQ